MSIREKATFGIIWNGTERVLQQILRFIIYVLLARMLEPSYFGLIGMLSIFIAVAQTFVDSGLGNALIQKKDSDDKDYYTVFSFNFFISLFLYVTLFVFSPYIASFYNQPILTKVLRVLSMVLVINSFYLVKVIKFRKILDFKKQAQINLLSILISGAIAIASAKIGLGVWSLVLYQLLQSLSKAILYNLDGIFHIGFNRNSFKRLFGYGVKLLIASLINNIFYNIYNLLIGKYFTATELGYYERSNKLQRIIVDNVNATIQAVSFPLMSLFQDNSEKLIYGYKKIFNLVAFLNFPLMFFLVISAKPLIISFLSIKWSPAIPFLQLLAFVGMLYPVHALNMNILEVKGKVDILLKVEIIKKIFLIVIIVWSLQYGIKGIIVGQIVSSLVSFVINSEFGGKTIGLGLKKQVIILIPYFAISFLISLFVYYIFRKSDSPYFYLLMKEAIVFFTSYLFLAKIFKMDAYYELKDIILDLIRRFFEDEK